uniref:Uncharacterized protein n=1 Tax=Macaca fascicularis TaxID=9541 RepID=A0A7N9CT57_MACFA
RLDITFLFPKNFDQCASECVTQKQLGRYLVHECRVCYVCMLVPSSWAQVIYSSQPLKTSVTSL